MIPKRGALLRDRTVVMLSSIEWGFLWQRHQTFASHLTRLADRVVFVESLPKRWPSVTELSRVLRRLGGSAHRASLAPALKPPNLTIISPQVLPTLSPGWDRINKRFFLPRLARAIRNVSGPKPIVITYLPIRAALDLLDLLDPGLVVYDCVTYWNADARAPVSAGELEPILLERADIVVADSDYLVAHVRATRPDVVQIPPGVDFEHFNSICRKPVQKVEWACYFGGVGPHIHINLLSRVAEHFRLLIVGPVRVKTPPWPETSRLTGPVPYPQLPSVLRQADALLLPYLVNDFTAGVIPAKFYECFATGRPIVGTAIPSFFRYRHVINVASSEEEFLRYLTHIGDYENEGKQARRLDIARQQGWQSRVDRLVEHIERALAERGP